MPDLLGNLLNCLDDQFWLFALNVVTARFGQNVFRLQFADQLLMTVYQNRQESRQVIVLGARRTQHHSRQVNRKRN